MHGSSLNISDFQKNNLRDITDALLSVSNPKNPDSKVAALSSDKIIITVNDIFGAGFATVSGYLQWMFLYLINFPKMQAKIQEEIDGKIGLKLPRFDDRKYLHYTEAFINELFRHTSFIPFTIPHRTLWVDPYLFKPERFLNENGELNKNLAEKVMIFGMGIRKCLGEEVARNEVFIILTTILQHLKLEKPADHHLDLSPIYGLSMSPKPYQLQVVQRT
uniref:Uncharacterized protein n=1 Tax=Sphaerodactylus townsendi TaxID=933632 RepID=A0ACB8ER40_9SAUR